MTVDRQPRLAGFGYRIDPMVATDRDGLFAAGSDPVTWAGHPATDRYKREVFDPYFDLLLASGQSVVFRTDAGQIIGTSRLYDAPDAPEAVAIGYTFLDCKFWGGAANFAIKHLLIDHILKTRPEVWFHIAPSNIRSQKATAKLGATWVHDHEWGLAGGKVDLWKCYVLTRADWAATLANRS